MPFYGRLRNFRLQKFSNGTTPCLISNEDTLVGKYITRAFSCCLRNRSLYCRTRKHRPKLQWPDASHAKMQARLFQHEYDHLDGVAGGLYRMNFQRRASEGSWTSVSVSAVQKGIGPLESFRACLLEGRAGIYLTSPHVQHPRSRT